MNKTKFCIFLLLAVTSVMGFNNSDWKAAAALEKHPGIETINVKKIKTIGDTLQFIYSTPDAIIHKGKDSSVTIQLGNAVSYGKEGEPLLPVIPVEVIIPSGKIIDNIKVTALKQADLSGTYQIDYQKAYTPLIPGVKPRESKPKASIYSSDNPFPGQQGSIVTVQKKHGITVAVISLNPVIYHPRSGKVTIIKNLKLEVFTRAQKSLSNERTFPEKFDTNTVGVENPEALGTYKSTSNASLIDEHLGLCNPAESYSYVIVTSRVIRDATTDVTVRDLIAKRQAQGITATIVAIEDVLTSYTGIDNAEKLRNFIKDAYANWETQYVLLGGDINIIPVRQLYSPLEGGMGIPSDLYYQCLDGTFNSDNDATWGEITDGPGGTDVDLAAEVYIGRASAETPQEMSNFVYKTLKYENSEESSPYIHKALMCGEYLGFGGVSNYAKPSMEEIRLGSSENGYTTVGFASCPTMTVNTLYQADTDWTAANLISRINSNNFSIINHLGHANDYTVMQLSIANVDALTNTNPIFLYTQGCYPGNFENDCIAEHFTTSTRSGLYSGVLNSRYGFGSRNSTDGPSQRFDRQFWDAYFGENILNIGKLNADSHEDNLWGIDDDYIRWCYYETNLFGDPYTMMRGKVTGPLVSYSSHTLNDADGNNDGIINPDEQIGLHVSLANNGTESADSVFASISCSDPYVTIIQDGSGFGTIPCCGMNRSSLTDYILHISPSCPTPHTINLQMQISDTNNHTWNSIVALQVYTSCNIRGNVRAFTSTLPVANAVISCTGTSSGTYTTDANGNFSFNTINGTYTITAHADGYLVTPAATVTVPPDTVINFSLKRPVLHLSDTSVNKVVSPGQTSDYQMSVTNSGDTLLRYSIAVINNNKLQKPIHQYTYDKSHFVPFNKGDPDNRVGMPVTLGSGGPDNFGYRWKDSNTPGGPVYTWNDISTTGRLLSTVSGCDDCYESVSLSFPFKYYGTVYSSMYVGSNGFITFGSGSSQYTNYPLPSNSEPSNIVAAFHDDLYPGSSGDVYFKDYGNHVVVQFNNVAAYSGSGYYTFQIVLWADGKINYYYKSMTGSLTSCTVGIQNGLGADGLSVAYNTSYIKNSFAVEFKSSPEWITATPLADSCAPASGKTIQLHFDASELDTGTYLAELQISHNDPNVASPKIIPVSLTVQNVQLPVIVNHPSDTTVFSGQTAIFTITATGPDLSYQWQRNGIDISGATGSSIMIVETSLADDQSQYRCIVSNPAGTVTSNYAILHVLDGAPIIVHQPHDTSVTVGQSALFSVEASGTALSYQWQRNGIDIPNASQEQYILTNVGMEDNDAGFRCVVHNEYGTITSNTAYLTVTQPGKKLVQIISVGTSGIAVTHGSRLTAENVNIGSAATGLVTGNRFKLFLK